MGRHMLLVICGLLNIALNIALNIDTLKYLAYRNASRLDSGIDNFKIVIIFY